MMLQTNDFFSTTMSIVNVLWPMFAMIIGLGLGFSILKLIFGQLRGEFFYDDYSTQEKINRLVKEEAEVKQSLEKRKNDNPPEEKEKPTAWRLGDDGEMVPVVSKRKNDDMFHLN